MELEWSEMVIWPPLLPDAEQTQIVIYLIIIIFLIKMFPTCYSPNIPFDIDSGRFLNTFFFFSSFESIEVIKDLKIELENHAKSKITQQNMHLNNMYMHMWK